MTYPTVTALYAACLAILFALLSLWVITERLTRGILHRDGGNEGMSRRIRAHGNFAEYVPFILLLTALLEAGGLSGPAVHALLAPLLIARLMHPFGMLAAVNSPQQFVFRGASVVVTLTVLIAAAGLLLARAW